MRLEKVPQQRLTKHCIREGERHHSEHLLNYEGFFKPPKSSYLGLPSPTCRFLLYFRKKALCAASFHSLLYI